MLNTEKTLLLARTILKLGYTKEAKKLYENLLSIPNRLKSEVFRIIIRILLQLPGENRNSFLEDKYTQIVQKWSQSSKRPVSQYLEARITK